MWTGIVTILLMRQLLGAGYSEARACGQGNVSCAPAVVLDETAELNDWLTALWFLDKVLSELSFSGLRWMGSTDHLPVVLGKGAAD